MAAQRKIILFAARAIMCVSAAGTALAHPHVLRATPAVGGSITAISA